ncbi:hypothetical protein GCM10023079_03950 [Streptomyces chitinivorans]
MRRLLGLLPKFVTSVSEAAEAGGAARARRRAATMGSTPPSSAVRRDPAGRPPDLRAAVRTDLSVISVSFLDCGT